MESIYESGKQHIYLQHIQLYVMTFNTDITYWLLIHTDFSLKFLNKPAQAADWKVKNELYFKIQNFFDQLSIKLDQRKQTLETLKLARF